jgi:WD40 repeat protein/uncharacterized caspase-like protein
LHIRTRRSFAKAAGLTLLLLSGWACHAQTAKAVSAEPSAPNANKNQETWPQLFVQGGHSDWIMALAFSLDESLLATTGNDGRLCLWDVKRGIQIDEYLLLDKGHSVAFSPDGKLVAVAAEKQIAAWDIASRKKVWELTGIASAYTVAFSQSSGDLFAAYSDNKSYRYQIGVFRKGDFQKKSSFGPEQQISLMATSADGSKIVISGSGMPIQLWDTGTSSLLSTLETPVSGRVSALAISGDGNSIVAALETASFGGEIHIHHGAEAFVFVPQAKNSLTGKIRPVMVQGMAFDRDGKQLLVSAAQNVWTVDPATGKELGLLDTVYSGPLAVAGKSHRLAIGAAEKVVLMGPAEPQPASFLGGHASPAGTLYSQPGRLLLASKQIVHVWSPRDNREFSFFHSCPFSTISVSESSDQKYFLTFCMDGGINLWDASRGFSRKGLESFLRWTPGQKHLGFASFLPGTDQIVVSEMEKILDGNNANPCTLHVVDAASLQDLRSFKVHDGPCHSIGYSENGKLAYTEQFLQEYKFWDTASWNLLLTLPNIVKPAVTTNGDLIAARIGAITVAPEFYVWDVKTGQKVFSFGKFDMTMSQDQVKHLYAGAWAWMPLTSNLAAGYMDGSVRLFDARSGKEVETIAAVGHEVVSLAFSHDGTKLMIALNDQTAQVWGLQSKTRLYDISTNGSELKFSSDDKWILASGGHGVAQILSATDGKPRLSLLPIEKGVHQDWLAISPNGLFDGTPEGWNRVSWRFSSAIGDLLPAEVFFNDFFYPGLVDDILMDRPLPAKTVAAIDRHIPVVQVASNLAGKTTEDREIELTLDVAQDGRSGVRDVRLFRNGLQVYSWRSDIPLDARGRARLKARATIVEGKNEFTAYAFSRANVKSLNSAPIMVTGAKSLHQFGRVYVLSIGIDHYAEPGLNLRFAVADADAFSEGIVAANGGGGVVQVQLRDQDATKANVLDALGRLAGQAPRGSLAVLGSLKKAQPEDSIYIYYAGHGNTFGGVFNLLPHEFRWASGKNGRNRAPDPATMISDQEIADAIAGIDSATMIMVLDACDSGQALQGEDRRVGPVNARGLAQLAYNKGMSLLAAAQGFQAAKEFSSLGHGLLTYVLVEKGLKERAADINQDGSISVREWLQYASETVPQVQQQQESGGADKGRGAQRKGTIAGPVVVQTPRAFFGASADAVVSGLSLGPPALRCWHRSHPCSLQHKGVLLREIKDSRHLRWLQRLRNFIFSAGPL